MFKVSFRRINGVPSALVKEIETGEVNRVWKRPWRGRIEDWCTCDVPYGRCDHIKAAKEAVRIARDRVVRGADDVVEIPSTSIDELAALDKLSDLDRQGGQAEQDTAESEANQEAAHKLIKDLEQELAAIKDQCAQEENARKRLEERHAQEKDDLEARIRELRGGTLRARQEEHDKAESRIRDLQQKLDNSQAQYDRLQKGLSADNEELKKQLAAATPDVMSKAWDLIRKRERLSAYREAMAILESKLRDVLGNPPRPNSSQGLDLYPLMEMAATKGHINEKQLDHLDLMRERRNSFAHNSEDRVRESKNPLTESEARAVVAYLGQVIDQLGA